jgi:hypothetical protein
MELPSMKESIEDVRFKRERDTRKKSKRPKPSSNSGDMSQEIRLSSENSFI